MSTKLVTKTPNKHPKGNQSENQSGYQVENQPVHQPESQSTSQPITQSQYPSASGSNGASSLSPSVPLPGVVGTNSALSAEPSHTAAAAANNRS